MLPTDSMIGFCNGNVTSIAPKLVKYNRELANNNLEGAVTEMKDIIKYYAGSF